MKRLTRLPCFSLCCTLCLAIGFLFPLAIRAGQAVEVTIQGIESGLYDNVAAGLKIFQKKAIPGLTDGEVARLHRGAEKEIREALEPFGYYSPVITGELAKQSDRWTVRYSIDPGRSVRVSKVEQIVETIDASAEEIEEFVPFFPLKKGDVLDHELYRYGKKRVIEGLFSLGFLEAEYVSSEIRVNRTEYSAEIHLHLRSGPRYRFGKTEFYQDLLDVDLLRNYLPYAEGDFYSPRQLAELQRLLYKTNFFGQVVVNGEIGTAEERLIPVTVRLTEPQFFNRYSFGLGYATDTGIRGKVGWDNRLFNSHGHTVSSELNLAQREDSLKFIYGVPVADPRFDKALLGVTYEDKRWDNTDTRLFTGGISYEHAGKRYKYGGGLELRDEKYQVGDTSGSSFLPVPHLNWSVVFADDFLHTRRGIFASAKLLGASEDLLGDTSFLQGLFSGKGILTPIETFRIIGRVSFGATLVDSIDDLPPSLRFYAGGDQSVRGYGYNDLGPKDSSGTVVGGRYLLFGSIEAEKIVSGNWSMAAFFDAGNAVDNLGDTIKEGVGIGVRYRLPFGQIRADLASAISEDDNPLRFHITLGGDL